MATPRLPRGTSTASPTSTTPGSPRRSGTRRSGCSSATLSAAPSRTGGRVSPGVCCFLAQHLLRRLGL
eukprot:14554901-Alexandrium_andersonii.AAC.1